MTKNEWKEEKTPKILTEGANKLHVTKKGGYSKHRKALRFWTINSLWSQEQCLTKRKQWRPREMGRFEMHVIQRERESHQNRRRPKVKAPASNAVTPVPSTNMVSWTHQGSVTPEHRASNSPWASPDVTQTQTNRKKKTRKSPGCTNAPVVLSVLKHTQKVTPQRGLRTTLIATIFLHVSPCF